MWEEFSVDSKDTMIDMFLQSSDKSRWFPELFPEPNPKSYYIVPRSMTRARMDKILSE